MRSAAQLVPTLHGVHQSNLRKVIRRPKPGIATAPPTMVSTATGIRNRARKRGASKTLSGRRASPAPHPSAAVVPALEHQQCPLIEVGFAHELNFGLRITDAQNGCLRSAEGAEQQSSLGLEGSAQRRCQL